MLLPYIAICGMEKIYKMPELTFVMSPESKSARRKAGAVYASGISSIFKAYDIRGVYPDTINERITYKIGRAFAYFLKAKDVIVGSDMRISSPKLSRALMKGIADQGANAVFIGQVCTDAVYFASGFLNKPGVMFTASHN